MNPANLEKLALLCANAVVQAGQRDPKLCNEAQAKAAREVLQDALATLPAPSEPWRPMSTAPKDGKKFLAYTSDFQYGLPFNQRVQEARWSGKSPDDPVGHFQSNNGQIVMYWQPLPPPPKMEGS